MSTLTLEQPAVLSGFQLVSDAPTGEAWYAAAADSGGGDALHFRIEPEKDAGFRYLHFDILLAGDVFVTFALTVTAGDARQDYAFSPLTECQTRLVFDVPPEFDFSAGGEIVISIRRKTDVAARFRLWPIVLSAGDPPRLTRPLLPRGPLIDAMGQSTLHDWPNRTPDVTTMVARLQEAHRAMAQRRPPPGRSRWGGWAERNVGATGFFRTHHDGRRWWLVDPDGCLFWSSGLDCVHSSIDHEAQISTCRQDFSAAHAALPRPLGEFGHCYRTNPWHDSTVREFNYLEANFIRAFGAGDWYEAWSGLAFAALRDLGFNTAGDWSDEAAASRHRTPYARALELWFDFPRAGASSSMFPDVFNPEFPNDALRFAEASLSETIGDPAMLGYFLHNEPAWHNPGEGPAMAMLLENTPCYSRRAFREFLQNRYGTDAALATAWSMPVTFECLEKEPCRREFTVPARRDIEEFSTVMLEKLLGTLSSACRRIDPDHLNLGVRWWTFPPLWALTAMESCDVISFNYYEPHVARTPYRSEPEPGVEAVVAALDRPFLIGEWHFGCLGHGLPAAGLCRVADDAARGQAFRTYLETAAALPWCVGAHWFTMYDRTALYSGTQANENYSIGFFDITHRRHEALCAAARASHERIYEVAAGRLAPHDVPVPWQFPSR